MAGKWRFQWRDTLSLGNKLTFQLHCYEFSFTTFTPTCGPTQLIRTKTRPTNEPQSVTSNQNKRLTRRLDPAKSTDRVKSNRIKTNKKKTETHEEKKKTGHLRCCHWSIFSKEEIDQWITGSESKSKLSGLDLVPFCSPWLFTNEKAVLL